MLQLPASSRTRTTGPTAPTPPKARPSDPKRRLWNGTAADPRAVAQHGQPDRGRPTRRPPQLQRHADPRSGRVKCENGLAATTFFNQQTGHSSSPSTGIYRGKQALRSSRRSSARGSSTSCGSRTTRRRTGRRTPRPIATRRRTAASGATTATDAPIGTVCADQQFIDGDQMLGPMHTNDRFYTCGLPQFGQTANDAIEASDPDEYQPACGSAEPSGPGTNVAGRPDPQFPTDEHPARQ